jgi:hypothetical protein
LPVGFLQVARGDIVHGDYGANPARRPLLRDTAHSFSDDDSDLALELHFGGG